MSTAVDSVDIGTLITRTPGIKGGTPHIAGTGVTVRIIVRWSNSGLSPEEISIRVGQISLAQVHGALAFYYANQAPRPEDTGRQRCSPPRPET